MRIQEEGIFYKSSRTGKTLQVRESEFSTFEWMRAARGYEVKIVSRDGAVTKFAGFKESVGFIQSHSYSFNGICLGCGIRRLTTVEPLYNSHHWGMTFWPL